MFLIFWIIFILLWGFFSARFVSKFAVDLQVQSDIFSSGKQSVGIIDDGRFIVVWSVQNSSSSQNGIFGQQYDYLGNKNGDVFRINTNTSFTQKNPSISVQKDGGFVVVWESQNQDGDGLGIYCQMFDSYSQKVGFEFKVNNITKGDQFSPAVSLTNSYFIVVWVGPDDDGFGIYGQIYDYNGNQFSDVEARLNNYTLNDQTSPGLDTLYVTTSSGDVYLYAIVEWMSYGQDGSEFGIYGCFFSYSFTTGELRNSSDFRTNTYTNNNQSHPQTKLLSPLDQNLVLSDSFTIDFIVVWQSYYQDGSGYGVYGQIYTVHISPNSKPDFAVNVSGNEFQINSYINDDQTNPSIAYSKNRGFIVVWQSRYQDGDGFGIFAQEFDGSGKILGVEQQINEYVRGDQLNPYIVSTKKWDFVITWISASMTENGIALYANLLNTQDSQSYLKVQGGEVSISNILASSMYFMPKFGLNSYMIVVWNDDYIYLQIINSQYYLIGSQFRIEMKNTSNPAVGFINKLNDFVVVWQGFANGVSQIYGQIFNITPTNISEIFLISENTEGETPALTTTEDGLFYVAWSGFGSSKIHRKIYAQGFFSNGTKQIITEFAINSNSEGNQTNPDIKLNKDGSIIVIWNSIFFDQNGTLLNSIVARWLWYNQNVLYYYGADFVVHNFTDNLSYQPKVSCNSSGYFLVVWQEINLDGSGFGIFGQLFDEFFIKVGNPNFQINSYNFLDQINPSIIMDANGYFIVAWESYLQDSDGYGVFAQLFDFLGHKIGSEMKVNTQYSGDQIRPKVANDENGNWYVYWESLLIEMNQYTFNSQKYLLFQVPDNSTQNIIGFKLMPSVGKHYLLATVLSEDGNFAFSLQNNGILSILKVKTLKILDSVDLHVGRTVSMVGYQNILYISTTEEKARLLILEVADISNVTIINNSTEFPDIQTEDYITEMKIFGSKLYAKSTYLFYIFDLSNPILLSHISHFDNFGNEEIYNFIEFYVFANTLILSLASSQLLIYDIKNLPVISIISNVTTSEPLESLFVSGDGNYLFTGSEFGLKVFDLLKIPNLILVKAIFLDTITNIAISKEGQYLSLTSFYSDFLFDIRDPSNPYLLTQTELPQYTVQSCFSHDNNYIITSGEQGLNFIKLITVNSSIITPRLRLLGQQYQKNTSFWIKLSPSEQFFCTGQPDRSVSVFAINDPTGSSLPIVNNLNYSNITVSSFNLFSFNSSGIDTYQVINETILIKQTSIDNISSIIDYFITKDGKYLILSILVNFTNLQVFDVTDPKNLQIIGKIQFNFSTEAFLSVSPDETRLFMSCQEEGILVVNITDKSNPNVITNYTDIELVFQAITYSSSDHDSSYILTSNYETLIVYEFYQANYSLAEISKVSVANEIFNLLILNNANYIVSMDANGLTLINIHNKTRPIILDQIQLRFSSGSFKKITVTSEDYYIFIPGTETVGLYDYSFDLYPQIFAATVNSQQIFTITMFPINLKTKNGTSAKIKLISVNYLPSWISVDESEFSFYLIPSSKTDLENWEQPVTLFFTRQLDQQVFSPLEIQALQSVGILDSEYFITSIYDSEKGVSLNNKNLSNGRINFILNQYFAKRNIYFSVDQFLDLAPVPIYNQDLQAQFDESFPYTYIKADLRVDFQFSSDTFFDPEGSFLSFSTASLPDWLLFDKETRRFYGSPLIQDIGNYTIGIIASNGFHSAYGSFSFQVRYGAPYVSKSSQSQIKSNPQVDLEFTLSLKPDTFIDPNNDTLTYFINVEGQKVLPSWISFDDQNLIIDMNPTEDQYAAEYVLIITAQNKYKFVEDKLSFKFVASWIFIIKICSEIIGPVISVIGFIKYRSNLFNFFFKKYYYYKEAEIIQSGYYFEKQIFLISEDLVQADLIWKWLVDNKKVKGIFDLQAKDRNNILENLLKISLKELFMTSTIDEKKVEFGGTLFEIIECYITHRIIKKHIFTNKVYKNMKSTLWQKLGKAWYLELVSVQNPSTRNARFQKFPELCFNQVKIQAMMRKAIPQVELKDKMFMRKSKQDDTNMLDVLICRHLKADFYGIPKKSPLLELSKGESILVNSSEIIEIQTRKKKNSLKQEKNPNLEEKFGLNYAALELFNNRKLPDWMDYTIKNGILIFQGTPKEHEIGNEYHFTILHSNGMIIRSFSFNIVGKILDYERKNSMENLLESENIKVEIIPQSIYDGHIKLPKDSQETLKFVPTTAEIELGKNI